MKIKSIDRLSVQDILYKDFGEDEWLVEGLIPTGTLTVISGQPASFKTWVCMHLALVVPIGAPFLKHFKVLARRKVLILDKENHPRHVQSRLKALNAMGSGDVWYSFDQELQLDDKSHIDSLIKYIKEEGIGLVIIDSLIRFHSGDENDAKQMSKMFSNLKKIINETNANVIFTHHHRKESAYGATSSSSLRGSSDISAAIDCHLSLSYDKKDKIIAFSHLKSRQSPEVEPFSVKIISDELNNTIELEYVGEYEKNQEKIDEASEAIEKLFESNSNKTLPLKEISELLGSLYRRNVLNSALAEHVESGYLTKTVGKANKALYTKVEQVENDPSVDNSVDF